MCLRAFMCEGRESSVEVCWVNYNCRIYKCATESLLQLTWCMVTKHPQPHPTHTHPPTPSSIHLLTLANTGAHAYIKRTPNAAGDSIRTLYYTQQHNCDTGEEGKSADFTSFKTRTQGSPVFRPCGNRSNWDRPRLSPLDHAIRSGVAVDVFVFVFF